MPLEVRLLGLSRYYFWIFITETTVRLYKKNLQSFESVASAVEYRNWTFLYLKAKSINVNRKRFLMAVKNLGVHFFGKIHKWIIAWDHKDSFLPKKQRIWNGLNRGSFLRKKRKIQKRTTILARRPLATYTFFELFPKETQKRRISFFGFYQRNEKSLFVFRIRIRIFPKEMHPIDVIECLEQMHALL